ncbi:MAG TPA: BTAD domain-containing putative transcriptional regulator [Herpetosiphonaceae bacterium]
MKAHRDGERTGEVLSLAEGLLHQGEQCAQIGLPQQAIEILGNVWTMSVEYAPELADSAAWEIGWLAARRGRYAEAAAWFARVAQPPANATLWPIARETLLEMCSLLDQQPAREPDVAVSPPSDVTTNPSALPPLVVTSLGCFHVTRAGTTLPTCKARKSIAIFRYLLLQRNRAAHKDELIDLFWPDSQPREAMHSLHVAISGLRRYLDPTDGSYLLLDAGHYQLHQDAPIDDDCLRFAQLVETAEQHWRAGNAACARQSYSDAIACYQGDYYLDDRDLLWAVAEQERLLTRYLVALDRLGRILIAQCQPEAAVECFQRLLERDSYREDAHCQLMLCYQLLGRRGEALRQYQTCTAILAQDLGLEPMPETQALYHRILGDTG